MNMFKYITVLALLCILASATASKPRMGKDSTPPEQIPSGKSRFFGLPVLKGRLQQLKANIRMHKDQRRNRARLGSVRFTRRFIQFIKRTVNSLRELRKPGGSRSARMMAVRNGLKDMLADLEDVTDQVGRDLVKDIREDLQELREIVMEIMKDGDNHGWKLKEIIELTEGVLGGDGCVEKLIGFLSDMLE